MDFYARSTELKSETVAHRRFLHRNAEVGLDMPAACRYVSEKLNEYGIAPHRCGHGITATIGTGKPVVLLRADMDALPMEEKSGEEFACTKGNAHTCGHDFHTAMLLTAAKMLKENESALEGTIKLMFQPAEETLEGAEDMIKNGILQNPVPHCAVGFHVAAGNIPLGTFIYNAGGVMMNSADNFKLTVTGKGGHGGYPNLAANPITAAVHIYTALEGICARTAAPDVCCTVSLCHFQSGSTANIIPHTAIVEGTLRTDDNDARNRLKSKIAATADVIAKSFDTTAELEWTAAVPPLVCDEKITGAVVQSLHRMPIPHSKGTGGMHAAASEDFALVAEKIPSAFIYLSAGFEDGRGQYTAHHPNVLFNEDVCVTGAAAYAQCGWDLVKRLKTEQA